MLILIKTKYVGPTDTKPARVKAQLLTLHSRQLSAYSAVVQWHDYEDTNDSCPHNRAVLALLSKLKESGAAADPYTMAGAAVHATEWHRTGADNPTGYTYAAVFGSPCLKV